MEMARRYTTSRRTGALVRTDAAERCPLDATVVFPHQTCGRVRRARHRNWLTLCFGETADEEKQRLQEEASDARDGGSGDTSWRDSYYSDIDGRFPRRRLGRVNAASRHRWWRSLRSDNVQGVDKEKRRENTDRAAGHEIGSLSIHAERSEAEEDEEETTVTTTHSGRFEAAEETAAMKSIQANRLSNKLKNTKQNHKEKKLDSAAFFTGPSRDPRKHCA